MVGAAVSGDVIRFTVLAHAHAMRREEKPLLIDIAWGSYALSRLHRVRRRSFVRAETNVAER